MRSKPNTAQDPKDLRARAEARCRAMPRPSRQAPPKKSRTKPSSSAPQSLIHELQVHQVELEMQNTELREVRDQMEKLLRKYTELYDFAPVGYFSLDERGRILEVNQTGSILLNTKRARLLGMRLVRFLSPLSPPVFSSFMDQLLSSNEKPTCEVLLLKSGGRSFWASCHGAMAVDVESSRKIYHIAISDITAFKEAEDARRRLESLTRTNKDLKDEITRRQIVEAALKVSERNTQQLLKESQRMQEKLRHLSHRILHAQEEERKRISRQLHDEITQTLVGIHVQLETLSKEAAMAPAKLRRRILQTQRSVASSVQIVRDFARELRPSVLDDLGLIASLRSLLKEFTERSGVRVRFSTSASLDQLRNDRCIALYRVAQSALSNVFAHAKATLVTIEIQEAGPAILMEIADNGRGFDVDRILGHAHNNRLGLLGMRERLEMVGGSLAIESTPGQGTTLRVSIPFRSKHRPPSLPSP